MRARCKLNTLDGYCKESNGTEYFISFPAPCNKGITLLQNQCLCTCPNYMTFTEDFNNPQTDSYDGVIFGTKASVYVLSWTGNPKEIIPK